MIGARGCAPRILIEVDINSDMATTLGAERCCSISRKSLGMVYYYLRGSFVLQNPLVSACTLAERSWAGLANFIWESKL